MQVDISRKEADATRHGAGSGRVPRYLRVMFLCAVPLVAALIFSMGEEENQLMGSAWDMMPKMLQNQTFSAQEKAASMKDFFLHIFEQPTLSPSQSPTHRPSMTPSLSPSMTPSLSPSTIPTLSPTLKPSLIPTLSPTLKPTLRPSMKPTSATPTLSPTNAPSNHPTVYSVAPPLDENSMRIVNRYRGARCLIIQIDNRFNLSYFNNNSDIENHTSAFSSIFIAPSILSLHLWALEHNYGYVFMTSSKDFVMPFGNQWYKVPAVIHAYRIAKEAGIPYVLYLDTDMQPSDFNFTVEDVLKSVEVGLTTETEQERNRSLSDIHFLVSPDGHYWNFLVMSFYIYGRLAINSGEFLFRTTPQAHSILMDWWFYSTKISTAFELSSYPSRIFFRLDLLSPNVTLPEDWVETVMGSEFYKKEADGKMKLYKDGPFNLAATSVSSSFVAGPIDGNRFPDAIWKCCHENFCHEFLNATFPGTNSTILGCETITDKSLFKKYEVSLVRDTLYGEGYAQFPADQDRLNHLFWKYRDIMYRGSIWKETDIILGWCYDVESRFKTMIKHWCTENKLAMGQKLSDSLMRRFSNGASSDDIVKSWEFSDTGGWGELKKIYACEVPLNLSTAP